MFSLYETYPIHLDQVVKIAMEYFFLKPGVYTKLRQMIIAILFLSAVSNSLTIESTSSGGNWNDTLTWAVYTIPGQNDDIIIKGTVSVTSQTFCNNLTIGEGIILQNGGTLGWVVLNINGNITNNGTIQNNPAANELWINIGGDIVNNGI